MKPRQRKNVGNACTAEGTLHIIRQERLIVHQKGGGKGRFLAVGKGKGVAHLHAESGKAVVGTDAVGKRLRYCFCISKGCDALGKVIGTWVKAVARRLFGDAERCENTNGIARLQLLCRIFGKADLHPAGKRFPVKGHAVKHRQRMVLLCFDFRS